MYYLEVTESPGLHLRSPLLNDIALGFTLLITSSKALLLNLLALIWTHSDIWIFCNNWENSLTSLMRIYSALWLFSLINFMECVSAKLPVQL